MDAYFERFPDADRTRRGNKMARERMSILYDHSMAERALVLGTSNKTELLLGYGTLFGDMASALNPIGDLYKTQVYALARALGLPHSVLTKPPSADLWVGQSDEDELGMRYAVVDAGAAPARRRAAQQGRGHRARIRRRRCRRHRRARARAASTSAGHR